MREAGVAESFEGGANVGATLERTAATIDDEVCRMRKSLRPLFQIGEAFGGRDHGTVLHACRLVKDRMEIDAQVRQVVHYLEKQLLR